MAVCNETVWKVIDKARELEEEDCLTDYVTGAAVGAVSQFALANCGLVLSEDDALSATLALFNLEQSETFNGEIDPKVLTTEEWAKHVEKMLGKPKKRKPRKGK